MSFSSMTPLEQPYSLSSHDAFNFKINSRALEKNPLGDPTERHNYLLVPKGKVESWPLVAHLSGYFSTGYQSFQAKTLSQNFVQKLDRGVKQKKYPKAAHVFIDATTYWGGSQFINSPGCGNYEDYILKELIPTLSSELSLSGNHKHFCVMGGSSGGYGALSLVSQKKSPFSLAFAAAPDSHFESSLLPSLFQAAPELLKYKNWSSIKKLIEKGEIQEKRSFFGLVNNIAMALCYSPKSALKKDFLDFPIDLHTGELNSSLWKQWLKHDPVHFLEKRKTYLKEKEIYLDVGKYDNFSLQFGTRQIAKVLKKNKVKHTYTEFSGNHFGLSQRKLLFLETLAKKWKAFV